MRYQLRQSSVSLDRIHPFCGFVKPFSPGIVKNVFRAGRIHSAQNGQPGEASPSPAAWTGFCAHKRAAGEPIAGPLRRSRSFVWACGQFLNPPHGAGRCFSGSAGGRLPSRRDPFRHPPCGRRRMPPSPRAGKAFSLLSVLPFIRLALIRSRFFSSRCGPCRGWRRTAPAPRGPRESR